MAKMETAKAIRVRNCMNFVNQIIHGKSEDVMPTIPPDFVDLIITSPPYNVKLGDNKKKKDAYKEYDDDLSYDKYLDWQTVLFKEAHRILKSGGRICINIGDGSNGRIPTHADFTHIMQKIGFLYFGTIIWNKSQIGNHTSWGSWKSPSQPSFPTPFEFVIVLAKDSLKHEGDSEKATISKEDFIKCTNSLWEFPPETQMMQKHHHPAVFPEELPRRLIQLLSYKDDTVLDYFSGAGTTCTVAKQLERKYIGIEMSEYYVKRSRDRIENANNLEWL